MNVREILERVGEQLNVRRAFGEPIERGEVTVVPVAFVAGGGGGGGGTSRTKGEKLEEGEGGGLGGVVHPLGVYEIRGGETRFIPAVNATLIAVSAILGAAFVISAIAAALSRRAR